MPTTNQITSKPVPWMKPKNLHKNKMNSILMTIIILASLPYSSALSLPNGDPAPGRSPGPPESGATEEVLDQVSDYDATTTYEVEVTTVSEIVSERTDVSDACAFARVPSDSEDIVTLSDEDSDVNLTVSHPVFDADELVRGVVYDGNNEPNHSESQHILAKGQIRKRCVICYAKLRLTLGAMQAAKKVKKIMTNCSQCKKAMCLHCFNEQHAKEYRIN